MSTSPDPAPTARDALTLLAEYLEACQHRARVEGDYREGRRIHSLVEAMTAQHMAEDALTTLDPAHLRHLASTTPPAPTALVTAQAEASGLSLDAYELMISELRAGLWELDKAAQDEDKAMQNIVDAPHGEIDTEGRFLDSKARSTAIEPLRAGLQEAQDRRLDAQQQLENWATHAPRLLLHLLTLAPAPAEPEV